MSIVLLPSTYLQHFSLFDDNTHTSCVTQLYWTVIEAAQLIHNNSCFLFNTQSICVCFGLSEVFFFSSNFLYIHCLITVTNRAAVFFFSPLPQLVAAVYEDRHFFYSSNDCLSAFNVWHIWPIFCSFSSSYCEEQKLYFRFFLSTFRFQWIVQLFYCILTLNKMKSKHRIRVVYDVLLIFFFTASLLTFCNVYSWRISLAMTPMLRCRLITVAVYSRYTVTVHRYSVINAK